MGISSMFSDKYANFTGITGPKDENEIFVNDIKQTAEINIGCKIVDPPASTSENGGFELDSPFIYIVFHAKTQIPLLIGKLSDPGNAKPDYRRSTCKIPKVENGYIQDVNYNDVYPERHEVPVDETKVQVKCNPSYDLRISDSKLESTCDTSGWSGSFPNCTSNISI